MLSLDSPSRAAHANIAELYSREAYIKRKTVRDVKEWSSSMLQRYSRYLVLFLIVCCLKGGCTASPVSAQSEGNAPDINVPAWVNAASRMFLPVISHSEIKVDPNTPPFYPVFDRVDVTAQAAGTNEEDRVCVNPLTGTASAQASGSLQQCLTSGTYHTVKSGVNRIFPAGIPHIGVASGVPEEHFKKMEIVQGGGYITPDNTIVTAGPIIRWADLRGIQADKVREGTEAQAATPAVVDGGGTFYLMALQRVLQASLLLRTVTIAPTQQIMNIAGSVYKTPSQCGLIGTKVQVILSVWGHKYSNPPAVRIQWFDKVYYMLNGVEVSRPVLPAESSCMLNVHPAWDFRFITITDLQKEPSYVAVDAKVKKTLRSLNFFLPVIDLTGEVPAAPEGSQWALTFDNATSRGITLIVSLYSASKGMLAPQLMFLVGNDICVPELEAQGICRFQGQPE